MNPLPRHALAALAALGLAGATPAQNFVLNSTDIPQGNPFNNSFTENVDFGDVDLDGDFDAIFADGGDAGNDQNRIWINLGGLQGGTVGVFEDETAARFPSLQDDSRDVEFGDFDGDGDLDIYTSNTAQISNQGNRWWINQGGEQGGVLGHYADETATRWVGLNSAESSIPTSLLLPGSHAPETFIDWSCDCDFADLDADGDLDLFHSTYGGSFGGNVPSRIFLNDGDGHFEEFNPSGFKLSITTLNAGDPGLWCEGVQQNETTATDGSECDVTGSPLDIDLADIDGDLDIDILHGSRNTAPRMFANRLEENGGQPSDLGFRDVTAFSFPEGSGIGGGNYEQEVGDFENDGDIDVYGLNWGMPGSFGLTDVTFENDGTGRMVSRTELPSSFSDDNEGDFLDFDADGDLDLYVASFSGQDRLYRNELVETGVAGFVLDSLPSFFVTSLDADMGDLDNDGDTDVMVAGDSGQANRYLENVTEIPDVHGPDLYRLEAVAGHSAQKGHDPVRVQVYDNAPYYITFYNRTELEVRVDGMALPPFPMHSSGGQIFRGEIPRNLTGFVEYRAVSRDHYGNAGVSEALSYTNTGGTGNTGGATSPSSVGTPVVRVLSKSIAGLPFYLLTEGVAPGATGFVLTSTVLLPSADLGDGIVLSLGALAAGPFPVTADADGRALLAFPSTPPGLLGLQLHWQYFAADGVGGDAWASSARLTVTFQ